jgi:hypothetical protein
MTDNRNLTMSNSSANPRRNPVRARTAGRLADQVQVAAVYAAMALIAAIVFGTASYHPF